MQHAPVEQEEARASPPRMNQRPDAPIRCVLMEGFSLHANTHLHANDRQGLERLCRYGARGALALERLSRWGTEFSRASLRNASLMPEPLRVLIAGKGLGAAGAGAGPVMLSVTLHRARWRQAGGRRRLVHGSADGGRVGACVMEMVRSSQEDA
jgi:hypothetical protein